MTDLLPDATAAAVWRSAVAKVLKGRDVESLVTHTADGIGIEPLYPAAAVPGPTGGRRPCTILSRLDLAEPSSPTPPRSTNWKMVPTVSF